jgi:hypothetical protein
MFTCVCKLALPKPVILQQMLKSVSEVAVTMAIKVTRSFKFKSTDGTTAVFMVTKKTTQTLTEAAVAMLMKSSLDCFGSVA